MKTVSLVILVAGLALSPSLARATPSGTNGKIAWSELRDPNTPTQHRVIIIDGRVVTTPTVRDLGKSDNDGEPAWSPDGKLLGFTRKSGVDATSSIWVMDEGGTGLRKVFDAADLASNHPLKFQTFTSLVWPQKNTIGFVAGGGNGSWVVSIDGPPLPGGFVPVPIPSALGIDTSQYGTVTRCPLGPTLCIYPGPTTMTVTPPKGTLVNIPLTAWWPKRNTRRFAIQLDSIIDGVFHRDLAEVQFDPTTLSFVNPRNTKILTTSGLVSCSNGAGRAVQFSYSDPVPSPDGKFVLVHKFESVVQLDSQGRCLSFTVNRGINKLNENGSLHSVIAESNEPREATWQTVPANLTVDVTDGHGNPLDNLLVELFDFEDPTIRIDATPKNLEGGHYAFESLPPGDYRVRATLKDAQWFSFEIHHDYPPGGIPGEPVWLEKKLDFNSVNQIFPFAFTEDEITGTSLVDTPLYWERLDDLASIYFQTLRYVKFVRNTLQQDTGSMLPIYAFATYGPALALRPDQVFYAEGLPAVFIGTQDSVSESRESPGDPCPTNCEWHEFGHHLVHQFVMPGVKCLGVNHHGYANPDTCDSVNEGIASFLATQVEFKSEYGGLFDLESQIKASGLRPSSSGRFVNSEDAAVAAVLWDLVDASADFESTATIAGNRLHMPVTYRDDARMLLPQLWTILTQNRVETVRELHNILGATPPFTILTDDLDFDGVPDANRADLVFLMHGFFRADLDLPISTTHGMIHYDSAAARLDGRPYNDDVGLTNHFAFNLGNGVIGPTIIPRHQLEDGSGATVAVTLQDASGTPLHGGSLELAVAHPEGTRPLQRTLGAGPVTQVPLELPMYLRYLPTDGVVPPCNRATDLVVSVTARATLNGYVSPDAPSFDSCTYFDALFGGTGPQSLVLRFPEDSTPPATSIDRYTDGQKAVDGFNTNPDWVVADSWSVDLSCDDPVVGGFASGCWRLEYSVNGGAFAPYTESLEFADPGQHTLAYRSTDAADNAEATRTVKFGVLTNIAASPVTEVAGVASPPAQNGVTTGTWTVTVTCKTPKAANQPNAACSSQYKVDSAPSFTPYTSPVVISGPGTHVFQYLTRDVQGSAAGGQSSFPIATDTAAPHTSITARADVRSIVTGQAMTPWTVHLDGCSDDSSGCARSEYSLDAGPFQPFPSDVVVSGVGLHQFAYRSVDVAGNIEQTQVTSLDIVPASDQDTDGVLDWADNCSAAANPSQLDGDGDGAGNRCDADFNQNRTVDSNDASILKARLGSPAASYPALDLDENGAIDVADANILKLLFRLPPGPAYGYAY